MTPARETLHEETLAMLEVWRFLHHRDDEGFQCAIHRDGPDTCDCGAQKAFNHAAECVRRVAALEAEVATLREQAAVPEFLRPFLSVGENEDGEMWCLWIASPSLPEPLAERVPAIYYRYPTDEEDVKREAGEPDWGPDVDAMWAEFAAYHAARAGRTDA